MRAVNLIPAEQRAGATVGAGRSGGAAYAVLGVIGAIALLAVLYGVADHQVSSRKSEVASLQQRAAAAQSQAAQLAPYTSFVALRQARVQAVESLVDSRVDWAHAFHEFGRVLPHSASMTSLSGAIAGTTGASASSAAASSSVGSATPPGSVPVFTLTGCATSQSAVAETMNDLRLIDGVSTVTLQSSAKSATNNASAATSTGSGSCGKFPTYTLAVGFQPLPATSAASAAATARTVASTGGVK